MATAPGEFLKAADFLHPYCPYTDVIDQLSQEDNGVLEAMADFAAAVESGDVTCEFITDGKCALAGFAIEQMVTINTGADNNGN
jgi:hypothetical protein